MFRVLFVCSGNTCRSPMAEGLCRHKLGHFRLQDEVEVASAGLYAAAGGTAKQEAVDVMAEMGIDLSGHRTACVTAEKVRWADLILTMEEHHRQRLLEQFPESAGKAFVLKEYMSAPEAAAGAPEARAGTRRPGGHDIRDPFGQSIAVYRQCAKELSCAVADLCLDIYRRLRLSQDPV